MSGAVTVRDATIDDAQAMGALHVAAWQAAYQREMPAGYLAALDPTERAAMWVRVVGEWNDRTNSRVLVAEVDAAVAGFVSFGLWRDPTAEAGVGELHALNVDPAVWGQGAGTALLNAAESGLAELGYRDAVLWVVESNDRARALYGRSGWTPDGGRQTDEIDGRELHEVRLRRVNLPAS